MREMEKVRLVCLMKLESFRLHLPGRGGGAYPGREVPYLWVCLYHRTRRNRVLWLVIRRLVELKDLDEVRGALWRLYLLAAPYDPEVPDWLTKYRLLPCNRDRLPLPLPLTLPCSRSLTCPESYRK